MRILYLTGVQLYRDRLREVNNTYRAMIFGALPDVILGGPGLCGAPASYPLHLPDYVRRVGADVVLLSDPWHDFWTPCPEYPDCPPLYSGIDDLAGIGVGLVIESGDSQFYWAETVRHLAANPRSAVAIRSEAHRWRFETPNGMGLGVLNIPSDRPILYLPHGAYDDMVAASLGVEKRYDVAVSGSLDPENYPARARVATALRLADAADLRVDWIPHPADGGTDIGPAFWRRIAASRIAVAGTNAYGCLTMRYLEIPASGALAIGDVPAEAPDLRDHMSAVDPDDGPHQILAKIREAIAAPADRVARARAHVLSRRSFRSIAAGAVGELRALWPGG